MSDRPNRILIVEDSPEDREFYRRHISQNREEDYQFWETGSGEEGLSLCREVMPDCLLLDYQLPDLNGLEFLDHLRPAEGGDEVTVIMLTGHGNEAVAVQAMKKGVDDYLIKGINNDHLRQAVQSAIEKGELRRQVEKQRRELDQLSAERLQLVAELREQAAALAESNRRKDEFLATLAHELRNPLAPIRNSLQIMRLTNDERAVFEMARPMIERQVGHMVRLIDDLMDVSRVSRGLIELRHERMGLEDVVKAALEISRPAIDAAPRAQGHLA